MENEDRFVPMYVPYVKKYTTSAMGAIESGWISNCGENVSKASNALSRQLGVRHVVLMANGTCATHCLFLALKRFHPSIEKVYVPDNVYVAVWNTALMVYDASQIEVLPMDPQSWNANLSESVLMRLQPNAAIVIVHNVGNVIDVDRIHRIRPDLVLIEDNCEGLFGKYPSGKWTGSSHALLCSSCSFYGNKTITTGEGGAFLTQRSDVADYISKVFSQGMTSRRYVHDILAYNYRMTNVQAGFLLDQLEDIEHILTKKSDIWAYYKQQLQDLIEKGLIRLPRSEPKSTSAQWMFAIQIEGISDHQFEDILELFHSKFAVDVRPFFYPIEAHEHLRHELRSTTPEIAQHLNRTIIMLPSFPDLTKQSMNRVCDAVKFVVSHNV